MSKNSARGPWRVHEAQPLPRWRLAAVLALGVMTAGCNGGKPGGTAPTSLAITAVTPSSASAHTRSIVQISGAGFRSGVYVRIGGVSADVQAVTPSYLTVSVPSSPPGTVDVVVFNENGEQAQLGRGFTYLDFGVSEITPREGFPATVVRVHGTSLMPGTRVTFGGLAGEIRSVGPTVLQVKVPDAGSGTVDVVVIHPDGRTAPAGSFTFRPFNVTLKVGTSTVAAGAPLSVTYSNPHCVCNDFISERLGLFRVGDPDDRPVWAEDVWTDAWTMTLAAPSVPGLYEFRFFLYGFPLAVAKSEVITVTGGL